MRWGHRHMKMPHRQYIHVLHLLTLNVTAHTPVFRYQAVLAIPPRKPVLSMPYLTPALRRPPTPPNTPAHHLPRNWCQRLSYLMSKPTPHNPPAHHLPPVVLLHPPLPKISHGQSPAAVVSSSISEEDPLPTQVLFQVRLHTPRGQIKSGGKRYRQFTPDNQRIMYCAMCRNK